jgi:CubicO group peptidase (beta-lactamase class C family)
MKHRFGINRFLVSVLSACLFIISLFFVVPCFSFDAKNEGTTKTYSLSQAKPEEVGLSSEKLEALGKFIETSVGENKIPGAVVLVARDGKIAYLESFGMRDELTDAPMKTDSIFRIYSMTKPIVSVAVLMLMEEGKISLDNPISKYIPELKDLKVGVEGPDGKFEMVLPKREITILDLLKHTSGMTYGTFFASKVKDMYKEAGIHFQNFTTEEFVQKMGKLPLEYEPGTRWEYGRSTDVLGRLVEIVSGKPLDQFLEERIFKPLKMVDTGFYVKPENLDRLAQPGDKSLLNVSTPPKFLSGGGGLVSTAGDYARFLQMLLNGGELEGVRILSKKTVALMTKDHLGPLGNRTDPQYFPGPFAGFGLGVAVFNKPIGLIEPGTFFWPGLAGTIFGVNPNKKMFRILMFQNLDQQTKLYMWLNYSGYVEGAVIK